MVEKNVETQEIDAVLQRLEALSGDSPELASACAYYHRLLPVLMRAQKGVDPLALEPGKAQQKIDRGEPVLRGEELPLSSPHAVSLFGQVWEAAAGEGGQGASQPGPPHSPNEISLAALLHEYLDGDSVSIGEAAPDWGLDPALLWVIAQNCLKPFLHAWRAALMPGVDVSLWQKGSCPFCGSLPALAELRGPERARRLRCELCGADWPFARLQCVYCGNTEARYLGILQPEGELQRASIQGCSVCRAYLKMVITVDPIPAEFLPVEDLATLSMDMIARNFGYTRPER